MKINLNNLSPAGLEIWQYCNQPQKRLLAYVDRLYRYAYDEYGNCLGSIDAWNCKKDCAYLDSVNGVSYYGKCARDVESIDDLMPYYFIANRKYWGMIENRIRRAINEC